MLQQDREPYLFPSSLLPTEELAEPSPDDDGEEVRTGVLPYQGIEAMIRAGRIKSLNEIDASQIQPASLDLRLEGTAYRVPASFLPGKERSVRQRLQSLTMHELKFNDDGAVLEKGCVYIIPLQEALDLKWRHWAIANPKSSIGRLDVFTRVITDEGTEFDRVPENYSGQLYAEVSPRTFSILVRKGSRLNQLRIKYGRHVFSDTEAQKLSRESDRLAGELTADDIRGGVPVHVDVLGEKQEGVVGYRARKHAGVIDVDKVDYYNIEDFWESIKAHRSGGLILSPDDFYILASKSSIKVPDRYAAAMIAYDTLVGEFRVHYAGFFDPGFGMSSLGGQGTRAVLEVRSHEVPFMIEDGQLVGRLLYERMMGRPKRLYGSSIGSSYQCQGLKLSKHFRQE